jgi:ParB-like chromosome segregation protein Spo0J
MQGSPEKRLLVQGAELFDDESSILRGISAGNEKQEKKVGNVVLSEHPVSRVQWVATDQVYANDYNPNKVAPPEMKLLEHSIREDGFTQPIVVWQTEEGYEVVDGFHRHIVGEKLGLSHLPVVVINQDRADRTDRISATIRHNRARGKHQIQAMSDIVVELSRRNWSDKRIAKELGMDPDEVLRLKQITGLAELFADEEFSEAWE